MRKIQVAFLVVVLSFWACENEKAQYGADAYLSENLGFVADSADGAGQPTQNFAGPEGLAVAGDYVFVANAAYRFDGSKIVYDEGFVTVVGLKDFRVVNRIPTPAKNPQVVTSVGGKIYVLCSGETEADQNFTIYPKSDGAVLVLDANAPLASTWEKVIMVPYKPKSLVGYPSSMVISGDGRFAYLGSGTTAALLKVDLEAGKVLRGAEDPIALGKLDAQDMLTLEWGESGVLFVGSFNRDIVMAIDTKTDSVAAFPFQEVNVGKTENLDGVSDLLYLRSKSPDLFILLGLANAVQAMNTSQGEASLHTFAVTGTAPNRILEWNGRLLIVNSLDNNVQAVDIATKKDLGPFVVFPVGSNPYDMAIANVGGKDMLYVTGLLANALYEVDLSTGTVQRQVQ